MFAETVNRGGTAPTQPARRLLLTIPRTHCGNHFFAMLLLAKFGANGVDFGAVFAGTDDRDNRCVFA